MSNHVGPPRERLGHSADAEFLPVIAMLTDGMLRFAPPFDLATSALLAENNMTGLDGQRAVDSFDQAHQAVVPRYRLLVEEVVDETQTTVPMRREVVNCVVVNARAARAVLVQVLAELDEEYGIG